MKGLVFVLVLTVFPSAWAKETDEVQLQKGKVLTRLEEVPGSKLKKGITTAILDAPSEKVWDVITDFAHYKEFMPKFKESRVLEQKESGVKYYSYLNMPWPISDVTYECDVTFSADRSSYDFKMTPGTGKGVKDFYGTWSLQKTDDPKKTLATYSLFFQTDRGYPNWAVNMGTEKTIGQTMKAVRKRLAPRR
jgi:coenzyme Q-binding protein COQ10